MKRSVFLLLCTLVCATAGPSEARPGRTGLSFLKLGVGARAAGLGEAYTAVANDATALYWNPAGMTGVTGTDLTIIHTQWFQGITHEFVGAVVSTGTSAAGLGIILLTVDGLERRTDIPTEQPVATFSTYDAVLTGSYARRIGERISMGITAKGVYEKILFETASGMAFDLGVQYKTPHEGMIVGGSIRNVGPRITFVQESFALPREVRIGVGYVPSSPLLQRRALVTADVSKRRDEPVRLSIGGAYTYQERVSVLLGYQLRQDEAGLAAGLGVRLRRYRLDYAFAPFNAGLGTTHRFALGVRL